MVDIARSAPPSGGQVGDTVGEQAKRVASETAQQAWASSTRGHGRLVEGKREQRKAAGGPHTLTEQLHDMSETSDGAGLAPEVVRQASERARDAAPCRDR